MREKVGSQHRVSNEWQGPKHARKKTRHERWENAKESLVTLRRGTALVAGSAMLLAAAQTFTSEQNFGTPVMPFLNPFAHSLQLSTDPCTQISPLDTNRSPKTIKTAKECIRQEKHGEVVVVDFIGLGKKKDALLAQQTQKLVGTGFAGMLHEKVTVLPASGLAKVLFNLFEPMGSSQNCIDIPSDIGGPVGIAYEAMPILKTKYRNATVETLTPQNVCGAAGNANTGSNTAEAFQDGMPINNYFMKEMAITLVHEGVGHDNGLGHQGHVYFRVDKNTGVPYVIGQTISIPGSKYHEYGVKRNIMGTFEGDHQPSINYIQVDDLNASEGILNGPGVIHMQPIDTRWKTLNPGEVVTGDYASIKMKKPVYLYGYDGYTLFTNFLIIPKAIYNTLQPYALPEYQFWFALYDATNSHNVAWASNTQSNFAMGVDQSETITFDGQKVAMKVTEQGVAFRQLANS